MVLKKHSFGRIKRVTFSHIHSGFAASKCEENFASGQSNHATGV